MPPYYCVTKEVLVGISCLAASRQAVQTQFLLGTAVGWRCAISGIVSCDFIQEFFSDCKINILVPASEKQSLLQMESDDSLDLGVDMASIKMMLFSLQKILSVRKNEY